MNVLETCTGSATLLVSGSIAPSACAAMVRGFNASGRSVIAISRVDHTRPGIACKTAPCKTRRTRDMQADDQRPLLLRGAARSRRCRAGAASRPRQHDAWRFTQHLAEADAAARAVAVRRDRGRDD